MNPKPNSIYHALLAAQGNACFFCNCRLSMSDATRDHLTPRSAPAKTRKNAKRRLGGWQRNFVLACFSCNSSKGSRRPTQDEEARAKQLWATVTANPGG